MLSLRIATQSSGTVQLDSFSAVKCGQKQRESAECGKVFVLAPGEMQWSAGEEGLGEGLQSSRGPRSTEAAAMFTLRFSWRRLLNGWKWVWKCGWGGRSAVSFNRGRTLRWRWHGMSLGVLTSPRNSDLRPGMGRMCVALDSDESNAPGSSF